MLFCLLMYLKSNMDRFIGGLQTVLSKTQKDLKSNMDRFIGRKPNKPAAVTVI